MARGALDGTDAWGWWVRGWETFRKGPLALLLLGLFFVAILFVLNQIPVAGGLLAALLVPFLIAVLLVAVRELEEGHQFSLGRLLGFFRERTPMPVLLLLGLAPLAVALIQLGLEQVDFPSVMISLAGLLLFFFVGCALLYALPLVLFSRRPPFDAVRTSFEACLREPLAIAVFFALALGLFILAIIPLGMGVFVYLPVLAGAAYASFRKMI